VPNCSPICNSPLVPPSYPYISHLILADCIRILDNPVWSLAGPVAFEDSLKTIRQWFKICNFEHGRCFRASSVMPTRVIEVDLQDGSTACRLFEPPKGYNFPYVALSHCWGSTKTTMSSKTTRSNYWDFQREIQTSNLPSTYQDAVYIARKLNIRFLWIDSLCIIQDDEHDWEIESAKMASVYQNAYFTIAATASASSQESLLSPRPAAVTLELDARDGVSEVVHARLHPLGSQSLSNSPLFQRAWAFQEMILSPRILHFAEDQMYWQCRNDLFSEDGLVRLTSPLQNYFQSGKFISQDEQGGWRLWWEWVQVYSTLRLSNTKDKTAALAGLTTLYEKSRDASDKPLAGLWRSDLHFGLLWYSAGPKRSSHIENAPSWSWFKMNSPIMSHFTVNGMWGKNLRRTANILEADVYWTGQPLTSPLSGGVISMTSRIRPINLQLMESNERNISQLVQAGTFWTSPIERQQKPLWRARGPIFTMDPVAESLGNGPNEYTLCSVGYFTFDQEMPPVIANALCVEIVTTTNPTGQTVEPGTGRWMFRHDVLIVQPIEGGPGVYRRIGVGHILVGLYHLVQPSEQILKSAWDFFQNEKPYGITLV
jgi:hypothetical protein